ncbi:SMP-30/gluconolactonase/LRE family protein [Candidatus Pelagibacter sp.]|nr:SMP-30/gluconolactonase/LRE family protein [Candidatus Pelagibacter sp.]
MKIKTSKPIPLWKIKCKLGEGTLWVKDQNSIFFVDIKKKRIFSLNIKTKKKKIFKVNKEIGFIAHFKKQIFILGLQGEIRIQNLKTKKILKSIIIEPKIKLNRINDGKTDPKGNLWFGTMDNLERKIEKGSLYKLDKNLNLKKIDKNYRITNGPAFIDQFNFYHTDSGKKIIYKIKINKKNEIIKKNIFKKFTFNEGSPDGMTLDKNNNLWVAHYHGACVSVFDSKAKLIHRIQLPAKNITNCAFGGQNNNELFITSATKGMNKAELRKFRYSGFLFSVKTNTKGFVQKKFILSHEKKRSLL